MTNSQKEEIIMKYDNLIRHLCYSYHIKGYDKEELIQEVRTYICSKLDKYDSERGSHGTFIKYYTKNKLRNMHKSPHNKKIDLEQLYNKQLHDQGGDYSVREDIALAVAFDIAYKSEYKDIILEVIRGMSYRDIGNKYDIDKNKVYRIWNDFIKNVKENI